MYKLNTILIRYLTPFPIAVALTINTNCGIAVTNYTYTCGNIVNTIMTNEHTSLEKTYLLHFIWKWLRKGYMWGVSWRLNKDCNILTPSSSATSSTSFSFSLAAQPGAQRAASPQSGADSHAGILSSKLWLQLTELLVTQGYIIVWRPPASCAPNSTRLQSRLSLDIFDQMHLLFTQVHFLFDSSAGSEVNILHNWNVIEARRPVRQL